MIKEIDYVVLYAEALKKDNSIFAQQKMLIDSQIKGSQDLFRKKCGTGAKFKANARKYLRGIGLI
ncbi:MAG: hypothetical protein V1859_05235 [archaeon]